MEHGYEALSVMERHLADRRYFVGERNHRADLALYAHHACGAARRIRTRRLSHLIDWLTRIAGEAGHISIEKMPAVPLASAHPA